MGQLDFVQDLAVVTFCAGIGGFFCQKIGLSSVVGFMVAGLLIGPHTPFISIVVDENGIVPRSAPIARSLCCRARALLRTGT